MRNVLQLAVVMSLLAVPSFAEEPGTRQLSVFVSNPGFRGGTNFGSHYTGGAGVGMSYWWTRNLSIDLAAAREQYVAVNGAIGGIHSVTPVDLVARYHFFTDGRWQPYTGLGARYVRAPLQLQNRTTAEAEAGVFLRLSPSLQLQLGARQALNRSSGPSWDPAFKPVIGLSWRF